MREVRMFQTSDGRLFTTADLARSAEEAAEIGMPLLASLEDRFSRGAAVKDDKRTKAHSLLLWMRENREAIAAVLDFHPVVAR